MPTTALQRTPPQVKSSHFNADINGKDAEGKRGGAMVGNPVEEDGAGETVLKKQVKKTTKPEECGKKATTTVADKVPKKTAQRAKGTTSLYKAIEKGSRDCLDKTKAASGDKSKEEGVEKNLKKEKDKGKVENRKNCDLGDRKPKNSSSNSNSSKKPVTKTTKKPQKPTCPVASEEVAVISHVDEEPVIEVQSEITEQLNSEISVKEPETPQPTTNSVNNASSSSFLERLQMGVKAYFSNRSSFMCADKNKKEGGNRTRGRLGKGVKEDAKKTDPGFKFKKNNYISKSDLLFDLLRLISDSGGETSNFLTNKPNNSRNLKRKKLKHCVSIQIPRKGYFYRSSMQSEVPGQPLTSSLQLLGPYDNPRNKSKIKIFGLAPENSEITRIQGQKAVKKTLKNSNKAETELLHLDDDESLKDSFSRSSSSSKLLSQWYFDDDCHQPTEKHRSGKIVNLLPEFEEREKESSFILDNSLSADWQKKKKTADGVEGDCFEVSEPGRKISTTLETLTNCINSLLGNENVIKNLEITPVGVENNRNLQNNSGEVKKPLITPVPISSLYSSTGFKGDINPTAALMGEIDLHLELQNYIKAFHNVNTSKVRTKNTLNTKQSSVSKSEFHPEELFEKYEKNIGFKSAQDDFDELEEERIESRLACSQTQLSNILKQMQRTKPSKNESKQSLLTDKSIDNYEKIFPFGSLPYGELGNSVYCFGESIPCHLPTEKLSESHETGEKKESSMMSFNLKDMIEIYESILQEHDKFKRGGRKILRKTLSSRLINFLGEKLTQKQSKTNLMKLSKEISVQQGWKHSEKKIDSKNVEDYAVVYQKLLKSSLPIKQIIHLNSLLAEWKSDSEEWMKRVKNNAEKTKTSEKQVKKPQSVPKKAESLEVVLKNKNISKTSNELEEKTSSSKNLQHVLESFFNSKGKDISGLSNIKGKVLVDVKLTGSQIQVNDLSFVDNNIPPSKKAYTNETSELIIETLGKYDINNLFNEKKSKEKKQMKKVEKSKQTVQEKKTDVEKQKSILEFNYNEMQLRTQHPINPISECLEPKILDEKLTSSDTYITKKPLDLDTLKKSLGGKSSLKDFKKKETIGEKLNKMNRLNQQTLPALLKMKPPKRVKSLVDLKIKPVIWKKVQKTPSMYSRTIFCNTVLEDPQNKRFKGNKKVKKLGGTLNPQKKMQEQQKTNLGFLKSQATESYNSSFRATKECSSMEMLLSNRTPSKNDVKQSEFMPNLIISNEPEIIINSTKSSILFESLNNAGDDKFCTLNLIHSDTFLKRISHALFLDKDSKSLFNKKLSDIKFCPESDTKSREQKKPFITFVLTPEQYEKADIFADDVLLIQKNKQAVAEPFGNDLKAEKSDLKNTLKSIENFMEILSASNEETMKKEKEKNKKKLMERKFYTPSFSERKLKTRCQTCQLLSKQEYERKRKESKKVNTDSRLNVKSFKTEAKKVKSEDTKSFCCRDIYQNVKPRRNVVQHKIKIDSDEEKKTKVKFKETTEEFFQEKKNKIEKTKCETFSKISQSIENILLSELFETVKSTVNQVDDLKKKTLMSTIEEDLEKKEAEEKKWDDVETLLSVEFKKGSENPDFLKKVKKNNNEKVALKEKELIPEPLLTHETIDLEKKDSMYFDALEKKDTSETEEMENGEIEEVKNYAKLDPPDKSAPQNNFNPVPTTTNENPISEEFILNQISDSLLESQINYSLALLSSFLKKKEKMMLKKEKINNLSKLIEIVEENPDCTMTKLERTAWKNVFVLLDSLYQIMDEGREENIKTHLRATKNLVSNILKLNVSRLNDLHKFNLSVTPMENGYDSNLFGVVKQCLIHFKVKLGLENGKINEDKNEIRENEDDLMIKSSRESVMSEFLELKNKLVEEIKSVEKLFMVSDLNSSSSSGEYGEMIGFEDGRTQSDDWLNRTYGCMHLMQCLMKVWETRMSLITNPKDCFQ